MGGIAVRRVLVLGCAESVWRDAARALQMTRFDAVCAVNDIGAEWPGRLAFWATLHPELLRVWQDARADAGLNADYVSICHEPNGPREKGAIRPRIDRVVPYRWPRMTGSGSSGLFAVKAMMEEGFRRIVLAGMPMHAAGQHFYRASPWHEVAAFTGPWIEQRHRFADITRSMSGWTQEILGSPDPEWLAGS